MSTDQIAYGIMRNAILAGVIALIVFLPLIISSQRQWSKTMLDVEHHVQSVKAQLDDPNVSDDFKQQLREHLRTRYPNWEAEQEWDKRKPGYWRFMHKFFETDRQ